MYYGKLRTVMSDRQVSLFFENKEFIVKHNFKRAQPTSWGASYRKYFGPENQGRVVSASDEKEAVKIMADKFRLNPFYLAVEPATEKNKKGARGIDEGQEMAISEKKARLGSGGRFKALAKKLKAKGATDPEALAAWIGRKKYGKAKMAKLSKKGRSEGVFTDDFRVALGSLAESRSKFDARTVAKIARLTDINNHTEAIILGAKMLGYTKLVRVLEHVLAIQELENHLPQALGEYRLDLEHAFMDQAKRDLTLQQYARLEKAY
jgi:hypothetical protein